MGQIAERRAERVAEGDQRPRPVRGRQRPAGDRLRRLQVHRGHVRRPLQGRRLQPAQRQVRPVPGRPQLLVRHARPAQGRGQEVHRLRALACRAEQHRREGLRAVQVVDGPVGGSDRARRTPSPLGAAGVLVLLVIAGMAVYVLRDGVAVVRRQRPALVRRRRRRERRSSTRSSRRRRRSSTRCAPGRCSTAPRSPPGGAVLLGLVLSTLAALFIVAFAPPSMTRVLEPVVRLLAGVPSVIYGLIGILVLVPFVNDHADLGRAQGVGLLRRSSSRARPAGGHRCC